MAWPLTPPDTSPHEPYPSTPRQVLALAGFVTATFCAPLPGLVAMPGTWYAALNKPAWNPPAWIFGPAWTLLYTLMAVAAWLVWQRDVWRRPLLLYGVQLALNAAWTPICFGAHELGWALVEIVLLWIAILLTSLPRMACPAHLAPPVPHPGYRGARDRENTSGGRRRAVAHRAGTRRHRGNHHSISSGSAQ